MKLKTTLLALLTLAAVTVSKAQSELYPKHFDLEQVTLLDGPMKTSMYLNIEMLMKYDTDRLLTPFVRQAGLSATSDTSSPYYRWEQKHPNFGNWGGDAGFDLSGHVGGHYVSALALAYAASHDEGQRAKMKERLDYMLKVMKDCQDAYDKNTEGLYGFIGGQPINDSWKKLYAGDLSGIQKNPGRNSMPATSLAFRKTGDGCPSIANIRFWQDCAMPISMATARRPRRCSASWPTGALTSLPRSMTKLSRVSSTASTAA